MGRYVSAALRYARDGYPVLPVTPGEKHPLTNRGLHDATTDERTILDWWNKWPEANIGLRTGVLHDVLDVDGLDYLEEMVGGPDTVFDAGPCVHTPSGGVHIWYAPTGLGNKVKFTAGLDWRGENGYAIAPPSRAAAGAYRWDEQFGYDRQLFDVPPWLYRLLDPPPPAPPERAAPDRALSRDGRAYALVALRNRACELERTPEGQRNDELFKAAARCGELAALNDDEIETVLTSAAHKAGLKASETRATVRSGIAAGRNNGQR